MDRFTFYRMLGEAVYRIDGAYSVFSKRAGVSANMLWLISALNDGKPHTQSQLCWDWNYPRTTVNTLVKELEKKGYVALSPVPGTRRELYVVLTPSGREFAEEILRPVYEAEEALFQSYFGEASPEFVGELNRFSAAMKTYFTTEREEKEDKTHED